MGPPRTAKRTGETRGNRVVLDPNLQTGRDTTVDTPPQPGSTPTPSAHAAVRLFPVLCASRVHPATRSSRRATTQVICMLYILLSVRCRPEATCCTFSCLCVARQRPHAVHSALHAPRVSPGWVSTPRHDRLSSLPSTAAGGGLFLELFTLPPNSSPLSPVASHLAHENGPVVVRRKLLVGLAV